MAKLEDIKVHDDSRKDSIFLKLFSYRALALLIILLFLITLFSIILPNFFSLSNLKYTLLALSDKGIIVIGMTLALATGLIDLSVGSVFAFSGVLAALLISKDFPVSIAVIAGLFAGIAIGFLNGIVVEKLKVNFLITTLGTMGIFRGFTTLLSQQPIAFLPQSFTQIGQKIIFFQSPVWIMFILLVVFGILMARHRYFRQNYYIGGNERAATLSGIRVPTIKIVTFIIVGLFSAIAGIVYVARAGAATSTMGIGLELKVIAAAVIGGCSLDGGEGSIFGSFLGVIFMELILDILVFAKVSTYWHEIVTGIILILAVAFDQWIKRRREGMSSRMV